MPTAEEAKKVLDELEESEYRSYSVSTPEMLDEKQLDLLIFSSPRPSGDKKGQGTPANEWKPGSSDRVEETIARYPYT